MRRPLMMLTAIAGLAAAASAPVAGQGPTLEEQLRAARTDQARSEAEVRRLESAAKRARDTAARLAAEQAAAAQAIDSAEARITAEEAALRLQSARIAAFQRQLATEQRPIATLLSGLVMMDRRPPIVALADRGGIDELVRIRILLDSTMPAIRRRTAALRGRIDSGRRLQLAATAARAALIESRRALAEQQARFAALEARASAAALASGSAALGAGDVAIAGRETIERLEGEAATAGDRAGLAADLARQPPIPLGPGAAASPTAPLAYRLPAGASVVRGMAEVDRSGVRSRGVRLATVRGTPLVVPASGIVRFSGPYRDHDGVVIIDHGDGWLSLIIGAVSPLRPGARVRIGDPLGRATGPIEAELSRNGQFVSPAIIAGSSRNLSNGAKKG